MRFFLLLLLLDFQPFLTFSLSNVYSFQKEKQLQVTFIFKTPTPSSKPMRRCPEPDTLKASCPICVAGTQGDRRVCIHSSLPAQAFCLQGQPVEPEVTALTGPISKCHGHSGRSLRTWLLGVPGAGFGPFCPYLVTWSETPRGRAGVSY